MFLCLAALLSPPSIAKAPVLPPGCSPEFQRMVLSVEQSLQQGSFAEAAKKLQLLPKRAAKYSWGDSKVPLGARAAFVSAREAAALAWDRGMAGSFTLNQGAPADLKFSFEAKLADAPETTAPAGLATFVSETNLPRLESVSGLVRGRTRRTSTTIDIQNDVAYAIGTYLGVSPGVIPSTSMARNDDLAFAPNVVTNAEMGIAKANLVAVDLLRTAIHLQQRMVPAQPIASFDSPSLTIGPVLQGQEASVPLMITNIGQGELTYEILPSCSCISAGPAGSLKPNQARLVDIIVDTSTWNQTLSKKLVVLTNDADTPVRIVPLEVKITPRYRWIVPGGQTRVLSDSGDDIDLYLDLPLNAGIFVKDVRFEGYNASLSHVTFESWSDEMADPDHGEGKLPRSGYHVKLRMNGKLIGGRQLGTVTLITTNRQYPEITYNLAFQSGIVALPDSLNVGMVSGQSKPFYVCLTRPGKPYRVLSTTTSSKSLAASFEKVAGTQDYRVTVSIVGKPTPGDYLAVVHVYTDDTRQPRIDIPVRGTVE